MNKDEIIELVNNCEEELCDEYKKIDKICEINTFKVMDAFRDCGVSE